MRMCSGCGSKVDDGVRFCDVCKAERVTQSSDGVKSHAPVKMDGRYDKELDILNKGTRWQRVRAEVVKKHPFCNRCQIKLTEIVDHIIPAAIAIQQAQESGRWPCSRNEGYYLVCNLQGLCRSCHKTKTDEDLKHTGPWPSVMEVYDRQPKKVWSF